MKNVENAMGSIQPAAEVSNFSSSSELKLLWIIEDRDYPFSAKQLTENIKDVGENPGSLTLLCILCVITLYIICN